MAVKFDNLAKFPKFDGLPSNFGKVALPTQIFHNADSPAASRVAIGDAVYHRLTRLAVRDPWTLPPCDDEVRFRFTCRNFRGRKFRKCENDEGRRKCVR